jgi:hypothetical protein
MLRVFLRADRATRVIPRVRATILGGGAPWVHDIPPAAQVPAQINELDLGSSWNLTIPGERLVPGARIRLEVDPGRRIPSVAEAARSVEERLDVHEVPEIGITLVPVEQIGSGLTGEVTGPDRTLDSWKEMFRKVFPVATVKLWQGPLLRTTANLDHAGNDADWTQLLGELEQRRDEDWERGDTGRYLYGVVRVGHAGTLGQSPMGHAVAAGGDSPATYKAAFAHEMGHAFGLAHAPFNVPPGEFLADWPVADPAYAHASLGAVGLDLATGQIKAPTAFKDLMSYAPPEQLWVSDHNYKKVLMWRVVHPAPAPPRPVLTSVSPLTGHSGDILTVTGRFLETITQVEFVAHGVPPVAARFEPVDREHLRVTVPTPAPLGHHLRVANGYQGGVRTSQELFTGH